MFIFKLCGDIKFCFNYVSLDIDECATSGLCGVHGTCNNTAGSYNCLCDNGWTGDHCETGEKIDISSVI